MRQSGARESQMPKHPHARVEHVIVSARLGSARLIHLEAGESADVTATGRWKTHKRDGQLVETGPGGNGVPRGRGFEGCLCAVVLIGVKPQSASCFRSDTDRVTLHGPGDLRLSANDDPHGFDDNEGELAARVEVYGTT